LRITFITKTVVDNASNPHFSGLPRMAMPLGERPVFACIAWHQASQMYGLIARLMIRVTAYNSPNS
jgi:hypothetical protein